MSDAEPSGLARYGVAPKTIVREPTRDRHEPMNVCAECGAPAEGPSSQRIHHPEVVGPDRFEADVLPCYGWRCERHSYDVVMPLRAADDRSPDDGWTGVPIGLADGRVREISVPEQEVADVE